MMLKSTTLLEQLSDQEPSASRLMLFLERSCPSVNEIIPLTTITYHLLNYKILKKYSMREKGYTTTYGFCNTTNKQEILEKFETCKTDLNDREGLFETTPIPDGRYGR